MDTPFIELKKKGESFITIERPIYAKKAG